MSALRHRRRELSRDQPARARRELADASLHLALLPSDVRPMPKTTRRRLIVAANLFMATFTAAGTPFRKSDRHG